MDTELARTFLEIVSTGSFVRASERLSSSVIAVRRNSGLAGASDRIPQHACICADDREFRQLQSPRRGSGPATYRDHHIRWRLSFARNAGHQAGMQRTHNGDFDGAENPCPVRIDVGPVEERNLGRQHASYKPERPPPSPTRAAKNRSTGLSSRRVPPLRESRHWRIIWPRGREDPRTRGT
jgi:hypothetical protein